MLLMFSFEATKVAVDRSSSKRTRAAVALVLAAAIAPAQNLADAQAQFVATVKAQLRAAEPKAIAWAAHTAAEHRLAGLDTELLAALRCARAHTGGDWAKTLPPILDALIETGATVPNVDLAPLHDRDRGVVLLLANERLATKPFVDSLLLATFRGHERGSDAWRACGNLLCKQRHPGFVSDLLLVPMNVCVRVHSPECDGTWSTEISCTACGLVREDKDWPPATRHELLFMATAGAKVLVEWPFPVFVRRVRLPTNGFTHAPSGHSVENLRTAWLKHLVWIATCIAPIERTVDVDWSDVPTFVADVTKHRAAAETEWRDLVAACVDMSLLSPDAAKGLTPTITITLDDWRADKSVPLPAVR
jgi:hypothetical protein